MSEKINYAKHVFTPLEVANAGYNEVERIQQATGFGVNMPTIPGEKEMSDYFARIMPWEIVAVQAQTHNGKTTFTDWWEHKIAEQLNAENRDEVIVHVSLEESLEAMSFNQHSRFTGVPVAKIAAGEIDLKQLRISVVKVAGIPIYRIADSSHIDDDDGRPELTLSNIYRILKELVVGNVTGTPVKIALVVVDYLQALPFDPEIKHSSEENKRRLQVRNDVYRLRKMTVHLECPIIVNVQAKQNLEGSNHPYHIPGIYDGEETASIAQRFDRIVSLWMPKFHYRIGENVEGIGIITEDLFYVKVNKQRGGLPSGKTWALRWDFENRELLSAYGKPVGAK